MASYLKPFSGILYPGNYQIPTGQLEIDWGNSLSNGLVGCWVPGVAGTIDISGNVSPMTLQSTKILQGTPEGVGLKSNTNTPGSGMTALAPPVYKGWSAFTLYWRGMLVGTPVGSSNFIGICYDNAGNSPFQLLSLSANPGVTNFLWFYEITGSSFSDASFISALPALNKMASAAIAIDGTGLSAYQNGIFDSASSAEAPVATGTATTLIQINGDFATGSRDPAAILNIAMAWNRKLSAAEIQAIDLAPYGLLIPAEYDLPLMKIGAVTTVFRRTLSPIGTRIASRQVHIE